MVCPLGRKHSSMGTEDVPVGTGRVTIVGQGPCIVWPLGKMHSMGGADEGEGGRTVDVIVEATTTVAADTKDNKSFMVMSSGARLDCSSSALYLYTTLEDRQGIHDRWQ